MLPPPVQQQQQQRREQRRAKRGRRDLPDRVLFKIVRRCPKILSRFEGARAASRRAKWLIATGYLSVLILNCIVMRCSLDDDDVKLLPAPQTPDPPPLQPKMMMSEEQRRIVLRAVTTAICPIHAECEYYTALAHAGSHI